MKFNILIPMAGEGKRFRDVGYKDPKPFIKVKDDYMINHVIRNFTENCGDHQLNFIFITRNSIIENFKTQWFDKLKSDIHTAELINIGDDITEGAAITCLKATKLINNDIPLMIGDCDHLINDPNWFTNSIDLWHNDPSLEGGTYVFYVDNNIPKWSYCQLYNKQVIAVFEKQAISNIANTGRYFFKQGKYFVESAKSMISKNLKVNNEFYVAPVLNQMIQNDMKIVPFFVNRMHGLGTPTDLNTYLAEVKP